MSTLLRDVIDIPEGYGAEAYVLKLTDAVGEGTTRRTLDEYVVTPALAEAFDTALGVVTDALRTHESRGAFLTGSFGSGKSHFMAVLHALLRRDPAARAKTELQPAIARHDADLEGKKVLPLAFHLLAAKSMEQALFDGYLRQIRALHPDAPLPALHRSDALLDDAEQLRRRMGDQAFLDGLSGGATGGEDDEWGDVLGGGGWDLERYTEALAASADSPARQQLVSALVEHYFRGYTQNAEHVDIDTGLAVIAAHAKALGYDAVVLFLDELVLWLAFAVQDRSFFQREAQKITKLVESTVGHRAIPIVSFVARQMDLRRWLADSGASGIEQEALDRAFKHQEGRFTTIILGDDNLPYVAHQRLLQPRDAKAAETLQAAFARIDRRDNVWDVLLDGVNTDESHRGADEAAFRLTYPFSPALVSTLRSLASVMQRERTALKVMQRMLVERRDTLTIDDVIPVGDAYDFIVQSESGQPLDAQAAALFRSAQKLYADKLRPVILASKGLDESALASAEPTVRAQVAADERLAKTLLLSAVAPNVPALKNLTPQRLASLNHGSIRSLLPGGEAAQVRSRLGGWASEVPEIHIEGDGPNPTVRVQLTDIDYESIVEKAKQEDNEGRRRELVRDMVATAIGLDRTSAATLTPDGVDHIWRGTRRRVDVLFGNVRDSSWLADDAFQSPKGTWRVIIDHPFDEAGHSTTEDVRRVETLTDSGVSSETLVWLPRFLSAVTMKDLRRLVILDYLLSDTVNERWSSYANHLSEGDRMQARAILDGQRTNLRHSVEEAVLQAYGILSPRRGVLEDEPDRTKLLVSLDSRFDPQVPRGATFASAFTTLVDDAYAASFPQHPDFAPGEIEVRARDYRAVAEVILAAPEHAEKRVPLAQMRAQESAARRVAGPLGIAAVNEQYAVFGDGHFIPWGRVFSQEMGRREDPRPDAPVTVGELRRWIRATDQGVGLPQEAADLVILTFAMLRQMAWRLGLSPLEEPPAPGRLTDAMELQPQELPTQQEWEAAGAVAAGLLGTRPVRPVVSATSLASFEKDVRDRVDAVWKDQPGLVTTLEKAYGRLGLYDGDRLRTARAAGELVTALRSLKGVALVRRLAAAGDPISPQVAGRSVASASTVAGLLERHPWDRLTPLEEAARGEGATADSAARILATLRAALAADEFTQPAREALATADDAVYQWVVAQTRQEPDRTPGPLATPPSAPPVLPPTDGTRASRPSGSARRRAGESSAPVLRELKDFLDAHPDAAVTVTWGIEE